MALDRIATAHLMSSLESNRVFGTCRWRGWLPACSQADRECGFPSRHHWGMIIAASHDP